METDLQKRARELEEIIILSEITGDEFNVLKTQLGSMSCIQVSVVHQIITKLTMNEKVFSFERNYELEKS